MWAFREEISQIGSTRMYLLIPEVVYITSYWLHKLRFKSCYHNEIEGKRRASNLENDIEEL